MLKGWRCRWLRAATLTGNFPLRRATLAFFRSDAMNRRVVVGLAAILLCACAPTPPAPEPAPPPPPPPTPDQQFEALGQRFLRESPEQSPVNATAIGDHRFDDRLDDVS